MPALDHVDTILVVEDDYILATDLGETLKELGGRCIRIARTVHEALSAIDDRIQFATVDVKVGGETCLAVVQALMTRRVPFIYVSGYPETDHIRLPEAPWVSKPVDSATLRGAIDAISQNA